MKYIYITDCHWDNAEESEDVMLFPYGDKFEKLTPEIMSEVLNALGWKFGECYWVKAEEARFFCYSACWVRPKDEDAWINAVNSAKLKKTTAK